MDLFEGADYTRNPAEIRLSHIGRWDGSATGTVGASPFWIFEIHTSSASRQQGSVSPKTRTALRGDKL
jgi:hypothetical protein